MINTRASTPGLRLLDDYDAEGQPPFKVGRRSHDDEQPARFRSHLRSAGDPRPLDEIFGGR